MSDALAISGVTAVLQYYLHNLYHSLPVSLFGGTVTVSAQAPDIVQTAVNAAGTGQNQINLFLHQVTHNPGWRNVDLPSLDTDGKTPLKNPPLALDLHYLLTAYGYYDWQAEALLGYALLLLHRFPVLARSDVSKAITSVTSTGLPNLAAALATSGLADQIEMIKVTPATLGREEMAWLWTALKADYRPTFPFQVSVVLLQEPAKVSFPLPVMKRKLQALPMSLAQILSIDLPNNQPAALPGQTISINGQFLSGASRISLANQRLGIDQAVDLTVAPAVVTNTKLTFPLPSSAIAFPAGIYSLSVQFPDPSNASLVIQSTNSLPIAIAPAIQPLASVAGVPNLVNGNPGTLVSLTCFPSIWPSQSATLALNDLAGNGFSAPALPISAVTNSLSFQFVPALAHVPTLAVLQVDQVSSFVVWQKTPPKFTGPMVTI
jgi:hypothetical protein